MGATKRAGALAATALMLAGVVGMAAANWQATVETEYSFEVYREVLSLTPLISRLHVDQELRVGETVIASESFTPLEAPDELTGDSLYWVRQLALEGPDCVDVWERATWVVEAITPGVPFDAAVVTVPGGEVEDYVGVLQITVPLTSTLPADGQGFHLVETVCPLPTDATVIGFSVRGCAEAVVAWETANESDALGFRVYRDGAQVGEMIAAAYAGTVAGTRYEVRDESPGRVYRLVVVQADGTERVAGEVERRCAVYLPVGRVP